VERPFDENVLLQLASGDRERAARYIHMFAASLPSYRQKLRDALEGKAADALQDYAHDLAGAAAYCGANPLYRAAKQLDAAAVDASRDELERLVRCIADEIERLATMRLDRFE
jgi:HPt (histidine-containing phosphotransfer) domain-containing protein